jgi:quercetin dioxygenase-like cupin family protein
MNGITVKKIDEIEAYAGANAIPGIRFRPAGRALGVSAWGMNLIELDPDCSRSPEHEHAEDAHEEVYVVLRGSIVLRADGAEIPLRQGELVRVAPETIRQIVTRAEGATVLALGGTPGKAYSPSRGRLTSK